MKIGLSSKTLSQMDLTHAGQVDDPAAADGGARRGQRRDLGPARPAVPGAGRSRSAAGPRRHARRRSCKAAATRRRSAAAASSTRPTSGWPCATSRRSTNRRTWPGRRGLPQRRAGAPGRRGRGRRGLPAADRRRGHQRRPGPAADRREAAGGNTLEVTREVEAALDELRPGLEDVESTRRSSGRPRSSRWSLDNLSRALLIGCVLVVVVLAVLPVRLADGPHQPDGHPALAARRGAGAALAGRRRSTRWSWPAW